MRTPLNGCLASAEMLLDTPLGAEQRELAKTIRVSGSILLSTVSNFLDFFKMEAGKQLDVVRTEMDVEARAPASPLCRARAGARGRLSAARAGECAGERFADVRVSEGLGAGWGRAL